MWPNELFLGITLYDIFMILGIILGIVLFRKLLEKKAVPNSIISFYYTTGLLSVGIGLLSAILFQSMYHLLQTGELAFTGMTFLGGLIGGAAAFFGIYFLKAKQEEKEYFATVLQAAVVSLLLGHFLGRVGCFTAGCCHGIETDFFLGMRFPGHDHKIHPTQLYEAFVLLGLFLISINLFNKNKPVLPLYLIGYGIGRFLIEFLRGDERGTFIPGISPSQFWSIIMVFLGVYFVVKAHCKTQK